jgi:hypothetical protein
MAIEKIKIMGAVLELPATQHCQFSPFGPNIHLSLFPSSIECTNLLDIIKFSKAVCAMAIPVMEFQVRGFKMSKVLA